MILRNLSAIESKLRFDLGAFLFLDSPQIGRVLDVEEGKMSFIIGTVFCENIDRPNVFDEVENDLVLHIQFHFNLLLDF